MSLSSPQQDGSQMQQNTPRLTQLGQEFTGISPTKPLKLKASASKNSLASKQSELSQHSQYSMNSYETAMEFDNKTMHSQSSSKASNTLQSDDDTVSGLGIDKLAFGGSSKLPDSIHKPEIRTNDQSSFNYNDEETPKINSYSFPPNNNSLGPPPKPTVVEKVDDDITPKIQPVKNFSPQPTSHNTTSLHHRAHSSISYNVTPGLQKNYIIESRQSPITQGNSPLKTSRKVSPTKLEDENYRMNSRNDYSFTSSDMDDTTYSQESTQLHGLLRDRHNTSNLLGSTDVSQDIPKKQDDRFSVYKSFSEEEEELSSLFLIALHSFDSESLELSQDSSICLSFQKNDTVYVHSVDTSGWGEVTLIKNLKRGWVPINYFAELVSNSTDKSDFAKTRSPLKRLLISCAKFLNNPMDNPENGGSIFAISHVNDIRDGVKVLLEETDCLSRSTEIVRKRPIIRRIRKSLLAEWYSLMIKADSYKHSTNIIHLETLQLMIFEVLKKSIAFLETWSIESATLKKELNKERLERMKQNKVEKPDIPYLKSAPFAKERLNEIHNILISYIGLLLGRLDMIEHNPSGCQVLENVTHQMILLLRELLFINKSCVLILNDRNTKADTKNDDNLDNLLSLVSELVSSVKNFVTRTIEEEYSTSLNIKDEIYYYTPEGDELIGIISRMTRSISACVDNCYKYFMLTGDFRLSVERKYSDFKAVQITPEQFIMTCSVGLIKTLRNQETTNLKNLKRSNIKRQSRFSMVRSGGTNSGLTTSGSNLLQEFLPDSKSFIRDSVFEPYLNESSDDFNIHQDVKNEIVRDSDGRLIGASFRALVALLTDELSKPDQFFVSTFFLTFKLYSDGVELIENLIDRFNLTNKFDEFDDYDETGEYSSYESRLKNRRRLICGMFQVWLQSYWDYENDYNLLPTLINFFNEGVSQYLPIESKKLIEVCSKLTGMTPSKLKNKSNTILTKSIFNSSDNTPAVSADGTIQLVKRGMSHAKHSSLLSHSSSIYSISSLNKELDDDDYIFEEYELAKINTNNRASMLLPLPGINFNNGALLNKSQIQEIEELVLIYRRSLGTTQWIHEDYAHYYPVELSKMLSRWFEISQLNLQNGLKLDYNLVELNSFEVAKQLTIIESKIFLSIKPDELLHGTFTEKSKLNLSPNISHSLLFTNLLSEYVLNSILEPGIELKKRVVRVRNWLNVALSCYYLKNFNSLAAIIISLQNHMLSRLESIWDALPEKYQNLFNDLKKIIHPSNNYKGYRYKISKILDDSDSKSPIPVVPYINLFLQDLTFIHEGNKDFRNSTSFLRSRIINFDKFLRISKIVSNLEYLQVGYDQSITKKNKRGSIFTFNSLSSSLNDELSPILPLQELILLELWRVHQLNINDNDRYWTLSKAIKA